ncbi:putative odorant receptor 19b [Papilio machaon]|uniref:putative odorant receptor 19b n=1 Tax=Papilio machaon TaxID=76193 RepID=UPI001E66476E|nr:putative odorant receptor 19b [Papilio machaon]
MENFLIEVKNKFGENSFQNIIWWINLFPRVFGFSYFSSKVLGMAPLKKSPNREICTTFFVLQAILGICITASYDATFLFIFAHTAAMFEFLEEETMSLNDGEEIPTVSERINKLVYRHSLILNTVKEIQEIYSVTIGVSFGLEAISMCIFFVLPLNLAFNFTPIIVHGMFVFFLYCYQGQKITTAAERFQTAVYFCGWENFNIKEQKMILIMLRQSQKPVILKAGSVVPVCIYTFASTLQSIYKFVTAFKT